MGISIPEEELTLAYELDTGAFRVLALTNDLFSYEKELGTAKALGLEYCPNVVCALMEEHGVSKERAKELTCERIKESVARLTNVT